MTRRSDEASQRLEHELNLASQIQGNFLPKQLPELSGLEFAASLKPAHLIGGDFYDVQPVPGGLVVMVGDVAGKGVPAAMLTALIHATLKSETQHHQEPADLLRSINHLIYSELDRSETFITAFLAIIQTGPLRLSYASAGHTTTLLWRAKTETVERLASTGVPLGIFPQLEINSRSLELRPGDALVLYSDGITEAENSQGRVFGTQAMIDLAIAGQTARAQDLLQLIFSALDLHRGEIPLKDDVVLFLAKALPVDELPGKVTPFVLPAEKRSARILALLARHLACELRFQNSIRRNGFLNELEMAVSEIAANVVIHAYRDQTHPGRLQGWITLREGSIGVDLIDNGISFEPKNHSFDFSIADPPISGYGLLIARRLLGVCQYKQLEEGRNHWRLEKRIDPRRKRA